MRGDSVEGAASDGKTTRKRRVVRYACSKCGGTIPLGSSFCPVCGAKLKRPAGAPAIPAAQSALEQIAPPALEQAAPSAPETMELTDRELEALTTPPMPQINEPRREQERPTYTPRPASGRRSAAFAPPDEPMPDPRADDDMPSAEETARAFVKVFGFDPRDDARGGAPQTHSDDRRAQPRPGTPRTTTPRTAAPPSALSRRRGPLIVSSIISLACAAASLYLMREDGLTLAWLTELVATARSEMSELSAFEAVPIAAGTLLTLTPLISSALGAAGSAVSLFIKRRGWLIMALASLFALGSCVAMVRDERFAPLRIVSLIAFAATSHIGQDLAARMKVTALTSERPRPKKSPRRIVVLLGLAIVIAAAAYYFISRST